MAEPADGPAALPELARSLRTLGIPRDAATEAAHAVVFVPLLEARARAASGGRRATLAALRGASLSARISALSVQAAQVGQADPARSRARTALVTELLEPLLEELARLDELAEAVGGGATDMWDPWVAQLKRVFASADLACGALARFLARPDDDRPRR